MKNALRFAYLSGWRRGEIRGFRWDMVDRTAGTITLPDSKNDHGRVLPLVGKLADVITRREAARIPKGPRPYHHSGEHVVSNALPYLLERVEGCRHR